MTDGTDLGSGRLTREELLKWGAAVGGAGLAASLGARGAGAAIERLSAESGRLQVLDWAGYEVKPVWAPYAKKYPNEPPQFTFMTNEANALAKLNAGTRPDVVRPYVGYVKDFADSGYFQPWDPKLIPNLKQLNPGMVKAGQIGGKLALLNERLQAGQRRPNRIDPRPQGALLVLGPLPSSLLGKTEPPDD